MLFRSASTVLLAAFVFPLFAHWSWGGGWLSQLGASFGLGRGLVDAGGAGAIHTVGGFSAFAVSRIVGPRLGKYHSDGTPAAMPAHNMAYVLAGCFLAWIGYLGLSCAGAILFTGVDRGHVVIVPVNVTLSAICALLAAATVTRKRFGKTDASMSANAWVGGLVEIGRAHV